MVDVNLDLMIIMINFILLLISPKIKSGQRFVIQRAKRWKDNRINIAIALAQLHAQELAKSKKKKNQINKTLKKV
uniref:Uncharacterized protein n=1 Tax=Rhizophagus irregularis (strain DAOM 181602 / DAOM 197198 / MUCL 43194) TaxID=747089 RepID=U9UJ75_RHIID